jgi:hypothetical protein
MRYSSRGEDAGEGGIGGSRPRATGELQERRRLHPRRANRVDIARRGTRLFSPFFPEKLYFERKRRICQRAADQALHLSIFCFLYITPPKKRGLQLIRGLSPKKR